MERKFIRGFGLFMLVLLLVMGVIGSAFAKDGNLILLSINDLHGGVFPYDTKIKIGEDNVKMNVGGISRIATLIKWHKERFPGVLACDAGDNLMGPIFFYYHGEPEFTALSMAGIDVATLGNHEFDLGAGVLADALKFPSFPIVCANLNITQQSLMGKFPPFVIKEINGLRVGIFGLIAPELDTITSNGPFVKADQDLAGVAGKMVAFLNSQKCDVIVALTHIGLEADRILAKSVSGIHVILGGHSHDVMEKAETIEGPSGWRTLIGQAGSAALYMGRLNLFVKDGKLDEAGTKWELLLLGNTVAEDPKVKAYLEKYRQELDAKLGEPIGTAVVDLDATKKVVRGGEAAIGNFVADAYRWKFNSDIAIANGGGIRGEKVYPAGPFTYKDLYSINPFGNTAYLMKVKGSVVRQMLEISASALKGENDNYIENERTPTGGFLQLAGIKVTFDLKGKPTKIDNNAKLIEWGERVKDVQIMKDGKWVALDDNTDYSLATQSWTGKGGDKYFVLKEVMGYDTFIPDVEILAEYVHNLDGGKIDPKIEGRIVLEK